MLLETLAAVFLAEVAVMFLLPIVAPGVGGVTEALLDASILSVIAGPIILWRLRRVIARAHRLSDPEDVKAPLRLFLTVAAVIVIGCIATGVAFFTERYSIEKEAQNQFRRITEIAAKEVEQRINQPVYGLKGARGVYEASKSVERGEFQAYAESRDLEAEFPGVLGFGFVERVRREDLDAFVATERADEAPDFHVFNLSDGPPELQNDPVLYVIKHIFPLDRNRPSWGLNLGSEPVRRATVEHAIRTGLPTISQRVSLVQAGKRQIGFLYFVPVYQKHAAKSTREEREANLLGVLYAPIILEEALEGIDLMNEDLFNLHIVDEDASGELRELYVADLQRGNDSESPGAEARPLMHHSLALNVGGRRWLVETSSTPKFEASINMLMPTIQGLGGIALTVLLAATVWSLGTSRERAAHLAKTMTANLRSSESALREQVDRLDLTVNAGGIGTWDWIISSGEVLFNANIQTMLGYQPGEWKNDIAYWRDLVHPDDRALVEGAFDAHLNGRSPVYRCEHRLKQKDGSWRYVLNAGKVIARDDDGRPLRAVGIHMDIHAARHATESMRSAAQMAEHANRAKSEFLANMSHEIRTPLTAMLGYAELLRDDEEFASSPLRRREAVGSIMSSGSHLLSIINDILDLSKIEADHLNLEILEAPIADILTEIVDMFQARARGKGLDVAASLATPVPETIITDPTRLRQILMNLVGNAVKFTEHGHVSIQASVNSSSAQPDLVICVEDTGPGMTPAQVERLFKPFSQADGTVTRKFGGTGLGLTICRRLANIMNGTVELYRTEPGVGSTFRLRLPLVTPPGARQIDQLTKACGAQPSTAIGAHLGLKGRILLVEDGVDNQRLISFHLRKAGAEVDVADNGEAGLLMIENALAESNPYNVVVSDMQMPVMDGYTLARTLRSRGLRVPIIALTANAMAEERQRCIDAGCDAYATKPIVKAALLSIVADWIGRDSSKISLNAA